MEEKRSSYKKLATNTMLFAMGMFGSKILMLLLTNVYSKYLTHEQLGVNANLQNIANWLIPLVTVTINEAVVRFGLDKKYDKKQIFTIGNIVCIAGLAVLAAVLVPVSLTGAADKYIGGYSLLMYVYVLAAALYLVYTNFLRALEKVRQFAIVSIINTVFTLIGTIFFIIVFKLGNRGFLYSIITANLLSVGYMCITEKLWRFVELRRIDRGMFKIMFMYSLPLMPQQIMWLVTNTSDTFMTTHYLGKTATGILDYAYKIANLVSTVYLMFGQAWNMSAVLEDDSDDRDEFYSKVFHLNQCLLYILAAGCLMICRPLTMIWMDKKVWDSAIYAPILIYSTIFSCFTTFMTSIYLASKKTDRAFATSIIAAVVNITLNVILIPRIGLYGPPITTVVSYLAVFVVRCFDSRKIVPFDLKVRKIAVNTLLLAVMTVIAVLQHSYDSVALAAWAVLPLMFILITAMNIKPVWTAVLMVAPAKIKAVIERTGTAPLIVMAFLAAGFAVISWFFHVVLTVSCLVLFAAAAAYGAVIHMRAARLAGAAGLFLTIWASYGMGCAFIALTVLAAIDYLREADDITCTIGALSLIGFTAVKWGAWAAVFAALVIIFLAVVGNFTRLSRYIERMVRRAGRR